MRNSVDQDVGDQEDQHSESDDRRQHDQKHHYK